MSCFHVCSGLSATAQLTNVRAPAFKFLNQIKGGLIDGRADTLGDGTRRGSEKEEDNARRNFELHGFVDSKAKSLDISFVRLIKMGIGLELDGLVEGWDCT